MKYSTQCGLAMLFSLLPSAATTAGQSYKLAIKYQSLMNLRFYEANGGFLVEHLELVFPISIRSTPQVNNWTADHDRTAHPLRVGFGSPVVIERTSWSMLPNARWRKSRRDALNALLDT